MLYSILIYICILFGNADAECGYSSEFFQFSDAQCSKIEFAYSEITPLFQFSWNFSSLGIDPFLFEVSNTPSTHRCRGSNVNPSFNFLRGSLEPALGLYSFIKDKPGECDPASLLIQSRCQAIKLTAVLGEGADDDIAGSAQRNGQTLAQLHSLAYVPVVIQFDTQLYKLEQLQADGQTLVAALNAMSSYKLSIYVLLFDTIFPGDLIKTDIVLSIAWFSSTTRNGKTLPLLWMIKTDETGQTMNEPVPNVNAALSNEETQGMLGRYFEPSIFCSRGVTHFTQPTTDDRSFRVLAYPETGNSLGLNSGSIWFQIRIVNQVQNGRLSLKASCISRASEPVGFGSRKRLTDDLGRFVVDPCGSPQLLGRYANPRDNSLAHVKCFSSVSNHCFSPISTSGSIGFCWGTVSYFKAKKICLSYPGSYDVPNYSQITSGPCCLTPSVDRTEQWKSNMPAAMRSLSCHATSYLYWTQLTRASLADPSVSGLGTADAPLTRHFANGGANGGDNNPNKPTFKFALGKNGFGNGGAKLIEVGSLQVVQVPVHTIPVPLSLYYESSKACDMLEMRFSFEYTRRVPSLKPLSYTRSWHINTYQGFHVTFWPTNLLSFSLDQVRKSMLEPWTQDSDFMATGFAANSLIDFQSAAGMPPDFQISENGHTFCPALASDCLTSYEVRFAGYLTTSVTEDCEMWCEHVGDCILRVNGKQIYHGWAEDEHVNVRNHKAEQCASPDLNAPGTCTVSFLKEQYYEFSLAYFHFPDDENFVQLRWKCPSMVRSHSGILVTQNLTGGMTSSKGGRLVPHEVFWSRNAPRGLSYDVMPAGDCIDGTDVKFMLSHEPSHIVKVSLQSDTTGLSHCEITFRPSTEDWRGLIVHVSPSAVSKVLVAVASSDDPQFPDGPVDVYLSVCSEVADTSETVMCVLSFDGYLLRSFDPEDRIAFPGLIPLQRVNNDFTLYYDNSATYNLQVSARFALCEGPQLSGVCVIGGAVVYGNDAYGVYQEKGSNVLTFNDIGQRGTKKFQQKLRVEEEGFCTHFSAVTGFKVSFCLNDLKYIDIVVHIPGSPNGVLGVGSCIGTRPPVLYNDIYRFPRGFQKEIESEKAPQWCDIPVQTLVNGQWIDLPRGGEARLRIKGRNEGQQVPHWRGPILQPIPHAPESRQSTPDYCGIGAYLSYLLTPYTFSSTLNQFFSLTCSNSSQLFPFYVLRQSRNLIGYYFANREYMLDTESLNYDLKEAVEMSPFFCGGHAQRKRSRCECTTSNGYSYPECGGDSYAAEAVFSKIDESCQNEQISVLSDPTTGAIWKCYRDQCLSSKDGLKFEPIEDGEYIPRCFTSITWSDVDRTEGRTLFAYSNSIPSVLIASQDGGQSWFSTFEGKWSLRISDGAHNNGTFEGKVGNSWTITENNLCLRSATLSHAKKVIYCTNWWCDCLD